MRRERWPADVPLSLLVGLGALFLIALVGVAVHHGAALGPVLACAVPGARLLAYLSTLGVLLPAGVVGVVIISASLALAHQLWATRRLLRRVLQRRIASPARLRDVAREAGLSDGLDVVRDPAVFAFCYGFRQRRVCVSTGLVERLADDELQAVLRHEAHHARNADPLKILLSRTFASGLGFLPVAGALHDAYLAGKEICADSEAQEAVGRLPLARALVRLLDGQQPAWPAGVLAIGALTATEVRLHRLLDPDAARTALPQPRDWFVTAALVAGIFGFSHGAASVASVAPTTVACDPQYALLHPTVEGPTAAAGPTDVGGSRTHVAGR